MGRLWLWSEVILLSSDQLVGLTPPKLDDACGKQVAFPQSCYEAEVVLGTTEIKSLWARCHCPIPTKTCAHDHQAPWACHLWAALLPATQLRLCQIYGWRQALFIHRYSTGSVSVLFSVLYNLFLKSCNKKNPNKTLITSSGIVHA